MVEDKLRRWTNFSRRQPAVEDNLQWNNDLCWILACCLLPTPLCGIFLLESSPLQMIHKAWDLEIPPRLLAPGALAQYSQSVSRLPPKVIFHRRSSSTKDCLPPKFVFHQRLSSTEGRLPTMVVFHRRSSSTVGRLPPKFVFHQRSSSTEGHFGLCINSKLLPTGL